MTTRFKAIGVSALIAASGATSAFAQQLPQSEGAAATDPTQAVPAQHRPSAPQDDGEIIVTARRRAEALSSVPISVAAIGGDVLGQRGITRVDDLTRAVPSLTARPNSGRRSNSQYEIRGVSTNDSLITNDPTVGIYVNEVYRSRATGTNQSFFDIENVQVLYGPQGTLFGRNSTGGAVLITTRKPSDQFEAEVQGSYGNLDRRELTGFINLPLTDTLAVRLAGNRLKRDGYGRNVTTGERLADNNSWSGRASILWQPTDGIESLTIGSAYKANERGSLLVLIGSRACPASGTGPSATCGTGPAQLPGATPTLRTGLTDFLANVEPRLGTYDTALDASVRDFRGVDFATSPGNQTASPFERSRNYSITNSTSIQLNDQLVLKNIVGYNYTKLIAASDFDATPFDIVDTFLRTTNKTFTEELQLQGDMDRLNWVVGALYFRERGQDLQASIQNVTSDTRQNLVGVNKSYAAFAQGTYKLTDELSATAGLRYTRDEREARYINPRTINLRTGANTCTFTAALDPDRDCVITQKVSFNRPTYTLSLDYKPRNGMLFYVAHRYGYRSGGLQSRVAQISTGPLPPFAPETVKDVEVGFKGTFDLGGDATLRANLALYQAWYKNLQRSVTVLTNLPVPQPATTTGTVNSGTAKVKGLEASATLGFGALFNLSGFLGYVDGTYKDFPTVVAGQQQFVDSPFAAAKYTAGVTAILTPLQSTDQGTISWATDFSYKSHFFGENSLPFLEPESRVGGQTNTNSSLNWENIAGSQFSAQLWARNIFNTTQKLGAGSYARTIGISTAVLAEPRTYGVTLKMHFGE